MSQPCTKSAKEAATKSALIYKCEEQKYPSQLHTYFLDFKHEAACSEILAQGNYMSHSITIKADYLEKDLEKGPVVYQV